MLDTIRHLLKQHWGYESFRPLQERAIACVAQGRDSVVVLPTGGGKSICYQAPALAMQGLAIVVCPLISLMKDQVDALRECGVAAGRLDSSQGPEEQDEVFSAIRRRELKLLYVSPERLVLPRFIAFLGQFPLAFIAVDEAHCISTWGHQFRPEYGQLGMLREAYPGVAIHAYTATATERVRADICAKLALREPETLIGSFDRPNLVYRVERRAKLLDQVKSVIARHKRESGIVYCISRKAVDQMCADLNAAGIKAAAYHAGMEDRPRIAAQEAFIREQVDVIVATIAFGMGIDKSNVRYVIHAGMPKSLENYQQESGRAGRDGLEAECVLIYGGQDFTTWLRIISDAPEDQLAVQRAQLETMDRFCKSMTCRRGGILAHFDQALEQANCAACDICLGEREPAPESKLIAQKVLSCVVRLGERFGGDYTAQVLMGAKEARIFELGHDKLTTYGLLAGHAKPVIREWMDQLVAQGFLIKDPEFGTLAVSPAGWRVLRGELEPRLTTPRKALRGAAARLAAISNPDGPSADFDLRLFDALRALRKDLADSRNVPAYVVFGDAALRDMARLQPKNRAEFLLVNGVGERKAEQYADAFLATIREFAQTSPTI